MSLLYKRDHSKCGFRWSFQRLLLFSSSVMSDYLPSHGLQHARLPFTLRVCSNLCPLSQWCDATISSCVDPFFSCLQPFPTWGSFPMSKLFVSSGQSIGTSVSASVLPMNIQGWFLLILTPVISLLFKGLSRDFSMTTFGKHQLFGPQTSLWSKFHILTWLLEKS